VTKDICDPKKLLKEAERLIALKLKPQDLITRWRKACPVFPKALHEIARPAAVDGKNFR
jgi:chaperonin GroEL (HSP60 family)